MWVISSPRGKSRPPPSRKWRRRTSLSVWRRGWRAWAWGRLGGCGEIGVENRGGGAKLGAYIVVGAGVDAWRGYIGLE